MELEKVELLIEQLADLEHKQWMEWSKDIAHEVSESRRERWKKLWVPYSELNEEMKDSDREYARRVLNKLDRLNIINLGVYWHECVGCEKILIKKCGNIPVMCDDCQSLPWKEVKENQFEVEGKIGKISIPIDFLERLAPRFFENNDKDVKI
ncbi:MAG: hypothetical protein ACTSRU_05410 [Candidatus Hodarchaeales archaeon]